MIASRTGSKRHPAVAFLFDGKVTNPLDADHNKAYYISQELISRGVGVCWLQIGEGAKGSYDGITLEVIPSFKLKLAGDLELSARIASFCRTRGISCLYLDEWFFFRGRLPKQVFLLSMFRCFSLATVLDRRDPYVEFAVSTGKIRPNTWRYSVAWVLERAMLDLVGLIVLPSEAYAETVAREGNHKDKLLGVFRGVDEGYFNPKADGTGIRASLKLNGRFVIGWFGMMQPYRQIREVLIPLAKNSRAITSNAFVLIGGKGSEKKYLNQMMAEKDAVECLVISFIPHQDLPQYIAACDVLLCPIDTRFKFTQNTAWQKIVESIAVGRPVVATKSRISEFDFKCLKGVLWTGPDIDSFVKSITNVLANYPYFSSLALEQAKNIEQYSVHHGAARIADAVTRLIDERTGRPGASDFKQA